MGSFLSSIDLCLLTYFYFSWVTRPGFSHLRYKNLLRWGVLSLAFMSSLGVKSTSVLKSKWPYLPHHLGASSIFLLEGFSRSLVFKFPRPLFYCRDYHSCCRSSNCVAQDQKKRENYSGEVVLFPGEVLIIRDTTVGVHQRKCWSSSGILLLILWFWVTVEALLWHSRECLDFASHLLSGCA